MQLLFNILISLSMYNKIETNLFAPKLSLYDSYILCTFVMNYELIVYPISISRVLDIQHHEPIDNNISHHKLMYTVINLNPTRHRRLHQSLLVRVFYLKALHQPLSSVSIPVNFTGPYRRPPKHHNLRLPSNTLPEQGGSPRN